MSEEIKQDIFIAGGKSVSTCKRCLKAVSTTFRFRDVPSLHTNGNVENILVGVCDDCGDVVSVPYPTVSKIKEQIARSFEPIR